MVFHSEKLLPKKSLKTEHHEPKDSGKRATQTTSTSPKKSPVAEFNKEKVKKSEPVKDRFEGKSRCLLMLNSVFSYIPWGHSTVTDIHFGQNLFSILSSWKAHIRSVLYRYLLDKAVHTTRKFCPVPWKGRAKAGNGRTLDLIDVESPLGMRL